MLFAAFVREWEKKDFRGRFCHLSCINYGYLKSLCITVDYFLYIVVYNLHALVLESLIQGILLWRVSEREEIGMLE